MIIFDLMTQEETLRCHDSWKTISLEKEKMNSLQDIERAIVQLPKPDLRVLRRWFDEFEAEIWDQEFEQRGCQGGKT